MVELRWRFSVLLRQISAAKQLFKGWGVGRGRLEYTFEASLGVITVSLSSCVIGDAHFRAPIPRSRFYPLLTLKCVCVTLRSLEKGNLLSVQKKVTILGGSRCFSFLCGNVNKNTNRGWKKTAENNGFFPLKRWFISFLSGILDWAEYKRTLVFDSWLQTCIWPSVLSASCIWPIIVFVSTNSMFMYDGHKVLGSIFFLYFC